MSGHEANLPTLVRRAHAKINLALAVDRPDPSGMHPIASWMTCVDLADEIRVRRRPEGENASLKILGESVTVDWPAWEDLTFKAVRALENELERPMTVGIEVVKRIPAGGGLGGGSSDAATVLRTVSEIMGLDLPVERLREISTRIGSDVAFFLDDGVGDDEPPRPGLVTGLGDRIERLERLDEAVTLVCPPYGCPTGEVYGEFDRASPGAFPGEAVSELASSGRPEASSLFNDLAAPACRVRPELLDLLREVSAAAGVAAHLS
ncbi:MAG: hypothetical protein AAFU70_03865, partial [Planctomycetota bacterium]